MMKNFATAIILTLPLVCQAVQLEVEQAYPGDQCCTLFKKPNYKGKQVTLCHDGNQKTFNLAHEGNGKLKKKTRSYVCGKDTTIDLCDNDDNCRVTAAGNLKIPNIRNYNRKKVFKAKLGPYNPAVLGAVTVFEHGSCEGTSSRFFWDAVSSEEGRYSQMDLTDSWLDANTISSVMVPKGYTLNLYDDAFWVDHLKTVEGEYVNDQTQEMICRNVFDINDRTQSIQVVNKNKP